MRMEWRNLLPDDVLDLYEVHNYRHATEILTTSFPREFEEILEALRKFRLTTTDITQSGGNESNIPKRFSDLLHPIGWKETKLSANLIVKKTTRIDAATTETVFENYLDGHNIDYVKDKVAFDLEWNSKDQTFDRDLFAFRTFFDCGVISAAILVTRSATLDPVFKQLGLKAKYGASTTWMGKLTPRLDAGRNGGCPVLVFGITPKLIEDLADENSK